MVKEYTIEEVVSSQKKITNDLIEVTMKICKNIQNNEVINDADLELQKQLDTQKKFYDRIVNSMNKKIRKSEHDPFAEIQKQISEIKSAMPDIQRKM